MSPRDGILATLLYFKQWNVPMSPADCLRFLPVAVNPPTITQLETIIHEEPLASMLTHHQGFLVFKGDQESIWHRHECYNASLTKWRIALRTLRWIRWVPFLRLVAVTNTLPMGLATPESDIDLLIVARPGRLWLTRFLMTTVIHFLGKRRHGKFIKDRLCLSFYVDDEHMDLSQFFDVPRDLHYAYMVGMTTVIFEAAGSGAMNQFEQSNNWMTEYFPQHYWTDLIDVFRVPDMGVLPQIRRGLEWITQGNVGNALESLSKKIQKRKIYSHPDSRIHEAGQHYVMANDSVIKFHESRAREESRKTWEEECWRYGIVIANDEKKMSFRPPSRNPEKTIV